MNIDWIIPCRYAEVHDNLATIVGAGIDTWWFPTLPATVQVGIVVRLLAASDELGPDHTHTVRNIIRDPSGGPLSDLGGPFQVGTTAEADSARTEWLNGVALVTMIQFEATEPGTYTFEHIVDESSKSVPLHIAIGPPPGLNPSSE
ncbi:MAG: hypothetical protein Q8O56_07495 [Solirubrobacteraceae bacterium]|nr:hypothetical protein [Solirubrobacteraceae bacterium]